MLWPVAGLSAAGSWFEANLKREVKGGFKPALAPAVASRECALRRAREEEDGETAKKANGAIKEAIGGKTETTRRRNNAATMGQLQVDEETC
jgi:hypothetical protein